MNEVAGVCDGRGELWAFDRRNQAIALAEKLANPVSEREGDFSTLTGEVVLPALVLGLVWNDGSVEVSAGGV